jgi:adenine-specific DNA-methyltransferase
MTSGALPIREARGQRPVSAVASAATPVCSSAAAVLGGVAEWWARQAEAAGLSGRWLDVSWAVSAESPSLADVAGPTVKLLGSAEEVGQAYVSALPSSERSKYGRHYTPQPLADELWAMTKRAMGWKRPQPLSGCMVDPACGAGALLLPVLREHLGAASRVDAQLAINALPNYIKGIDNDPSAAWLASVLLASEMLPILARTERARRKPLPALARYGDGLAAASEPVQAMIMNPPYGRVRLADQERARFSRSLYGHANIYGLFMAAATESLAPGGVLVALVPTSFLAGRYFENLRAVLAEHVTLREIGFVADRSGSFSGVLQETCLVAFSRVRTRKVTVNNINGHISPVAKVASPRTAAPWLLPRRADDAPVAAAAINMPLTLAAAGWKISTGPLVWNRRKHDLAANPSDSSLQILWAADIDGGVIHRDSARDSIRFLKLRGNDAAVMVLDQPAVLIQRTTAPEQARRLVAAHLSAETLRAWGGRIVVENHVNVARPRVPAPSLSAEALSRLFATDTIDRVLRCLSGSVAVSAYELEALPLPPAHVLRQWSQLEGEQFSQAVAIAYSTLLA